MPEKLDDIVAELAQDGGCSSPCSLNITDYTKGCCGGGCSNQPSGTCFPCSNITNAEVGIWNLRPADLALLKAQLRLQLQEVEVREKLLEERMRVRTAAEAQELEQSLTEALRDLNELRANLLAKESGNNEG